VVGQRDAQVVYLAIEGIFRHTSSLITP